MKGWSRTVLVCVSGVGALSVLGFYATYFGLMPSFRGVSWMVHFHVLSVVIWFGLLCIQASLAGSGRLATHRTLGWCSVAWVPVVLLGFGLATHQGQLRHRSPELLGATFFDGGLFLLFVVLAVLHRKRTASHAQYMILTIAPFINPGLGRLTSPAVSVPAEFLFILTLGVVAYLRKQPFRAYLVGLGAFVGGIGTVATVSITQPWILEGLWEALWG